MILDLFPLPTVLFPRSTMPLHIFEPRYLQMIGDCLETETPLLESSCSNPDGPKVLGPVEIHRVGATAHIVSAQYKDNGTIDINVLGHERFEVLKMIESSPRMIAEVRGVNWTDPDNTEIAELAEPANLQVHRIPQAHHGADRPVDPETRPATRRR